MIMGKHFNSKEKDDYEISPAFQTSGSNDQAIAEKYTLYGHRAKFEGGRNAKKKKRSTFDCQKDWTDTEYSSYYDHRYSQTSQFPDINKKDTEGEDDEALDNEELIDIEPPSDISKDHHLLINKNGYNPQLVNDLHSIQKHYIVPTQTIAISQMNLLSRSCCSLVQQDITDKCLAWEHDQKSFKSSRALLFSNSTRLEFGGLLDV
ncbi:uncharacterized protein EV154DRAFT_487129 [Mucor mucedo]|uniref:uncharacterized protein n=1 Tax=Mucor mucedo TaxID=29922 RepID=UPI00222024F1|nr:uncharacterized protein EV154DRAFT_487129 [Mucor mucedo]KAI7873627.1 hypothetical protein EV154DRAFT_487129 [Mucor mucedo]